MKTTYLFDWGDTLMIDHNNQKGKMRYWDKVTICSYAYDALQHLSKQSDIFIATGAASSTPTDIQAAFKRVHLDQFITDYFCKENMGYTKPDKLFYLKILDHIGVKTNEASMVGNSLKNDIIPCHHIGMKTIWIRDSLQREKPPNETRIITNLRELMCKITED